MVNQSAFLQALGWAIINSLWQYAALWAMYLLVSSTLMEKRAAAKHNLAIALQLTGFSIFVFTFFMNLLSPVENGLQLHINFSNRFLLAIKEQTIFTAGKFLPWLSVAYLLIVCLLCTQFARYCYLSQKLTGKGLSKIDAHYRLFVNEMKQQLGMAKKISVHISSQIDTPLVVGLLKPFILIPVSCINQLSTEQLEAILLHELYHIKRNDYLLNLLVAITEIALFFNPFAVLLVKNIRSERENICDDMVLQLNFNPHLYASALLTVETNRQGFFNTGIAANGNGKKMLLRRVQRILNVPVKKNFSIKNTAILMLVFIIATSAFVQPVFNTEHASNPYKYFAANFSESNAASAIRASFPAKKQKNFVVESKMNIKKDHEQKNDAATILYNNFLIKVAAEEDAMADENTMKQAATVEQLDYSIQQPNTVISGDESLGEHPFVPNKSYEFYLQQDTTIPNMQAPSYNDYKAAQELKKTKLALEKIDWKKIEKDLKYSKKDIERMKAEVNKALAEVDFTAVQREVMAKELQNQLQQKYKAEVENYRMQLYQQQQKLMQEYQLQMEIRKQQIIEEQLRSKDLQQKNIELLKKQKQVYI